MKRALSALIGMVVGLSLALLYAWVISPVQYIDTAPNTLRGDYQAAYAQLAARAYAVDGDLGRARTRLALLGMSDPAQGVSALAQHAAATGADQPSAHALAALASALQGTPTAVVDRLNEAVSKIVGQPEVKQLWAKQGATPLVMTPEAFDKYARDDISKWATVIKMAGIKAD